MLYERFLPLLLFASPAVSRCYPPGPVFPLPDLTAVPAPTINLTHGLSWQHNTTSYSVQIVSSRSTLFESHHTAEFLGNYTDSPPTAVTGDTLFRIASITKAFTVLAVMLAEGMDLDDGILKYLPELARGSGGVQWGEVTLRALGGHMGGIVREYSAFDLVGHGDAGDMLKDPISHGFPPVPAEQIPPCGITEQDTPCTWHQLLRDFPNRRPVFPPNAKPTYANSGFILMGLALERHLNASFASIIQDSIFTPLNMTRSRFLKPLDSDGVIPVGPNDWTWDLGITNAAGGIYSSTSDLSKFLRILLPNSPSLLLPPPVVREWLRQTGATGSLYSAYGVPWELLRSPEPSEGYVVDVVSKGGGLAGYFSTALVFPQFGVAASILVAGDPAANRWLRARVVKEVVAWAGEVARRQARAAYAGRYVAKNGVDSRLLLRVDQGLPGLRIEEFVSNGTDMMAFLAGYYAPGRRRPGRVDARLVPTGLGAAWRMSINVIYVDGDDDDDGESVWEKACFTDVDTWAYAGESVTEFIFEMDQGEAVGVELPAFRITLEKKRQEEETPKETHEDL